MVKWLGLSATVRVGLGLGLGSGNDTFFFLLFFLLTLLTLVPFLSQQREALGLPKSHSALAVYDCFRGQTTAEFKSLLEEHNIITIEIPANCTDKLQPMDIAVNKHMKDALKKKFQDLVCS